jgi:hypothetical protein
MNVDELISQVYAMNKENYWTWNVENRRKLIKLRNEKIGDLSFIRCLQRIWYIVLKDKQISSWMIYARMFFNRDLRSESVKFNPQCIKVLYMTVKNTLECSSGRPASSLQPLTLLTHTFWLMIKLRKSG